MRSYSYSHSQVRLEPSSNQFVPTATHTPLPSMLLLSFVLLVGLVSPHPLNWNENIRKRQNWYPEYPVDKLIAQDQFPTFKFDTSFLSVTDIAAIKASFTGRESVAILTGAPTVTELAHQDIPITFVKGISKTARTQQAPLKTATPLQTQLKGNLNLNTASEGGADLGTASTQEFVRGGQSHLTAAPTPTREAITADQEHPTEYIQPNSHAKQDSGIQQGHTGLHDASAQVNDQDRDLQQVNRAELGNNGNVLHNEQIRQFEDTQHGPHEAQEDSHNRPLAVPSLQTPLQPTITYLPPPVIHQVVTAISTVYAPDPMQSGLQAEAHARHNKAMTIACALAILLAVFLGGYLILFMLSRRQQSSPSPDSPALMDYGARNSIMEKDEGHFDASSNINYTGLLLARDSHQLHCPSRSSIGSQRRAHSLPAPGKEYHMGSRWSTSSSDIDSAQRLSMEIGRWRRIRGVLSFGSGLAQRASLLIRHSVSPEQPKSLDTPRKSAHVPLLSPQEFFVLSDDEAEDDGKESRRSVLSVGSQITQVLPYTKAQL